MFCWTHFRYAQDAPCSPYGRQLASFAIPSTLRCSLPRRQRRPSAIPWPRLLYLFVFGVEGVGGGVGSISFILRFFTYGYYSSRGGYAGLITRMDDRPICFSLLFQKSKSITVPGSGRLMKALSECLASCILFI